MSAPPTGRPLPNAAVEHRLNHVGFGHLGRIAYSPGDNHGQHIGRLQTNRTPDSSQRFELLSRFREVYPPTRNALAETVLDMRPSAAAVSQKNWLLKTYPEAVAGAQVDAHTLAHELSRLTTASAGGRSATSSPLLAVGEISDHTDTHSGTVGRPAIAKAAGDGAHILHILTLEREELAWPARELSVRLPKVSRSAQGEWVNDGVPITNLRFAVDGRRNDPIRWLLVQKSTGTTLFEPDIKLLPFQGNVSEYESSHLRADAPLHISANPLCTIKSTQTGGNDHLAVCFNPAVEGRPPQLAIIDQAGQWSVWDITGSRSARPKILQPIMTARGRIDHDSIPSLRSVVGRDPCTYSLIWVLPRVERRLSRDDQEEQEIEYHHWGLYSRSPVRCKHLVVCSETDVRLYDATQGVQLSGIQVVNIGRAESILDLQICPISRSQLFVLTTSSLYWIEAKVTVEGQTGLAVICSYAHQKKADGSAIRLMASPLAGCSPSRSCAAFIVSGQDKGADMFVFTGPSSDEIAHATHQLICWDLPSSLQSAFVSSLPVVGQMARLRGKAPMSDRGVLDYDKSHILQLFGLTSDLGLGTCLLALAETALGSLDAPPSADGAKQPDTRRKKFLRHIEHAFVVPDSYQERSAPSRPDSKRELKSSPDRKPVTKRRTTIKLDAVYERLEQLSANEIGPAKVSRQLLAGFIHRRIMEELGDGDHTRIQTLAELVGDKLNGCNQDTLEDEWAAFREGLGNAYEGKVQVVELGASPEDLQSIMRQLSILTYVTDDTPELQEERQRNLVSHIAGKQYLSQFGISVTSWPPTTTAEGASTTPQQPSQALEDASLPPSSWTSSASSPRLARDRMDVDSSPARPPTLDRGPLARLRQYVDIPSTPATETLSAPSYTRLLSRWPTGDLDPLSYAWEDEGAPLTAEDEEAMARRRRREEARRKKTERLRTSAGPPVTRQEEEEEAGPPATQPVLGAGTLSSSQPGVRDSGSQRPRISMSQVVPGPHGARPGAGKKKKKGKSGFR